MFLKACLPNLKSLLQEHVLYAAAQSPDTDPYLLFISL